MSSLSPFAFPITFHYTPIKDVHLEYVTLDPVQTRFVLSILSSSATFLISEILTSPKGTLEHACELSIQLVAGYPTKCVAI